MMIQPDHSSQMHSAVSQIFHSYRRKRKLSNCQYFVQGSIDSGAYFYIHSLSVRLYKCLYIYICWKIFSTVVKRCCEQISSITSKYVHLSFVYLDAFAAFGIAFQVFNSVDLIEILTLKSPNLIPQLGWRRFVEWLWYLLIKNWICLAHCLWDGGKWRGRENKVNMWLWAHISINKW